MTKGKKELSDYGLTSLVTNTAKKSKRDKTAVKKPAAFSEQTDVKNSEKNDNCIFRLNLKEKSSVLLLLVGSLWAAQYHVALYLAFFVLPIYWMEKYKNNHIILAALSITIWFMLSFVIRKDFFENNISTYILKLNVLIISWIYLYLYWETVKNIYILGRSSVSRFFTDNRVLTLTVFIGVVSFFFMKKPNDNTCTIFNLSIILLLASLYIFSMSKSFTRQKCLRLNFLFSLSPVVSIVSFFYAIKFTPFSYFEGGYVIFLSGFNFLVSFQITTISAIFFYLRSKTEVSHKNTIYKIILFLMLSAGISLRYLFYK